MCEGIEDGADEGSSLGAFDGNDDALGTVGFVDSDGLLLGKSDGRYEGDCDGIYDGMLEGFPLSIFVGDLLGFNDSVGDALGDGDDIIDGTCEG